MPQPVRNAPDLIDLENLTLVLGEEYAVVVYFTVRLRGGKLELIGKTYSAPYVPEGTPEHVAMASWPVKQNKDMYTAMHTVAFDLWLQHDGGGATAAKRGAPYGWNGRVEVPRRRNAQ